MGDLGVEKIRNLKREIKALRFALSECRRAAVGQWRTKWQEKYFSRKEAVAKIASKALEVKANE